jgi:hypothetical protein
MWHYVVSAWQFFGAHFWLRLTLGLAFSVGGGWLVIPKILDWLWDREMGERPVVMYFRGYAAEAATKGKVSRRGLSWATGIVESLLYTCAILVNAWQWIGIWLVVKAAVRWQSGEKNKPDANIHLWLVGSGISVLFGYLGACIACGHFLSMPRP